LGEVLAALVLSPTGVINPVVNLPFDRLESHFLRYAGGPDPTSSLLPRIIDCTTHSKLSHHKKCMEGSRQARSLGKAARFIAPMRPVMVSTLPADRSKWLLEPKLDGYRAIAVKSATETILYSIDGKIYNSEFPQIHKALGEFGP